MPSSTYTIRKLLDDYDIVTIERGINGGYIVTVDDTTTSGEQRSIHQAIVTVLRRLRK